MCFLHQGGLRQWYKIMAGFVTDVHMWSQNMTYSVKGVTKIKT